jgi:hypothetical protein
MNVLSDYSSIPYTAHMLPTSTRYATRTRFQVFYAADKLMRVVDQFLVGDDFVVDLLARQMHSHPILEVAVIAFRHNDLEQIHIL